MNRKFCYTYNKETGNKILPLSKDSLNISFVKPDKCFFQILLQHAVPAFDLRN